MLQLSSICIAISPSSISASPIVKLGIDDASRAERAPWAAKASASSIKRLPLRAQSPQMGMVTRAASYAFLTLNLLLNAYYASWR